MKEDNTIVDPIVNSQNDSAFNRGNATSGAPICNGMIRFPNAKNNGVANISSINVPCIVNSWLYCSGDRNCIPGCANSARISSAITPPITKNANATAMYIRPMVLWSVVRSRFDNREPLTGTAAGLGRLMIGAGAIVTIASLDGAARRLRRDRRARRGLRFPWFVAGDVDRDGDRDRF